MVSRQNRTSTRGGATSKVPGPIGLSVERGLLALFVGLVLATVATLAGLPDATASSVLPVQPQPVAPASEPLSIPPRVRVGLATDLEGLSVPCCGGDIVAEGNGTRVAVAATFIVQPHFGSAQPGSYRLQVAAFKDEVQAAGLATRLERRLALPADSVFDAGLGLYRIRVGRFPDRESAEAQQQSLRTLGFPGTWVVSEPGRFEDPALRVKQGGKVYDVPGRWLTIRSLEAEQPNGIRVKQGRFRGNLLIYLNDRGLLNLINEVSLEDYLRGVVPREMGPEVYDSLEALKAQTVAARTYTLRNMGEFEREGYDICATPRCQVYGGMDDEHPLSDRAVSETESQVLVHAGELVDALYSSTCGGHTEDVQSIFPLKNWDYLRGVPCIERGVDRLTGASRSGAPFPEHLMQSLLPVEASGLLEGLEQQLGALAERAGVPRPEDRLGSLERREVRRYVASIFDMALDARLFGRAEDLAYYVEEPPRGWRQEDLALASYFVRSGFLDGPVDGELERREGASLLYQLARYLHVLEVDQVVYRSLEDEQLSGLRDGEALSWTLPASFDTYRWHNDGYRTGAVGILPGDPLELFSWDSEVRALTHRYDPRGVAFDRTSPRGQWTRFREHAKLSALVRERYPEIELDNVEVLERGVSGRVKKMRLMGRDGLSVDVEGLAIRWTLDLPDTWFTLKRVDGKGTRAGWLFTGRGWGHGVGMCQVGAFGMGLRGHQYRDILHHYYTDVSLVRLPVRQTSAAAEAMPKAMAAGAQP